MFSTPLRRAVQQLRNYLQSSSRRCRRSRLPTSRRSEFLEERCLLAAQVITPAPQAITTATNNVVTFDVMYETSDPENADTTGVTLRMHYNSAELTPDIPAITNSAFAGATIQDTEDLSDVDDNPNTDRYVNFLWFDFTGNFPADSDLPINLFTATFQTSAIFDGESVDFTGSPPVGFDLETTSVQISSGVPLPTLTVGDAPAVEEGTSAVFPLSLSDPAPVGGVTVTYATNDGTAVAGQDYTASVGQTVTIPEGETSGAITIQTLADSTPESTEEFSITITDVQGAGVQGTTATGTILDETPAFDFDIDGNGQFNPFQDAVLMFAWMSEGTPDSVLGRFIGSGAQRDNPAAVRSYLDANADLLDIDLNSQRNPFQDAVQVFAWMSQGTPDSVLQNFIDAAADSSRDSPTEIRGYLNGLQNAAATTGAAVLAAGPEEQSSFLPDQVVNRSPAYTAAVIRDDSQDSVFAASNDKDSLLWRDLLKT